MMFSDIIRWAIFVVVWAVLVTHTPTMLRDRRRYPLLAVLMVFAGSSIIIQPWFATAVNRATGVTQFHNFVQGVWSIVDISATLAFVVHLAGGWTTLHRRRLAWVIWALLTAVGMLLFFALTSGPERFPPVGRLDTFAVYALLQAAYLVGAAGVAAYTVWRHLSAVRNGTLFVALWMVMIGDALMIPFMVIRTAERITVIAPWFSQVALLVSTARFVLLPLGCVIVATGPLFRAVAYWYRRIRIYSLWCLLSRATPEIILERPVSRLQDLLTITRPWVRLHRRVIEIRDTIFYLYDAWASTGLVGEAGRYAESLAGCRHRRALMTACWLEATRLAALAGSPKRYDEVDKSVLPELLAEVSTMGAEVRGLLRLHRTLRTSAVRTFVTTIPRRQPC